MQVDVEVINHGSLFGLTPKTDAGEQWLTEHLPEDTQCLGKSRFCEPRYVEPIVEGMRDDGLTVA